MQNIPHQQDFNPGSTYASYEFGTGLPISHFSDYNIQKQSTLQLRALTCTNVYSIMFFNGLIELSQRDPNQVYIYTY